MAGFITRTWKQVAWTALVELAESGEPFTADDLLDVVGPPDSSHPANGKNSAIGALFGQARHVGLIDVVGTAQSKAPHRKGGLIRVWRGVRKSTLFDEGGA